MSESTTTPQARATISGPGLTKPGIVILQSLLIALFAFLEILIRHGVGILTDIALLLAVVGGIRLGRKGTQYVTAVTPPIAFAIVVFGILFLLDGIHITRLGLDFLSALSSAAPYLLLSAIIGWAQYFRTR